MTKPHIAFLSFPHPPEVNPTIPIAAVLVRRGYRVSFVTSEQFASRLAAVGADVIRCPAFNPRSIYTSAEGMNVWSPVGGLAIETVEAVTPLFEKDRPDLLIYDTLALAGRILANRWRIPAAQTTPMFAVDPDNLNTQIPDPQYRGEEMQFSEAADSFLQKQGVASSGFAFHREKLSIYLFPKALQVPGNVFGRECFYAGRCAAEQPYYGHWHRKAERMPFALVSNSTTYASGPEFFRVCIDALSGLGMYVVLSIGSIDPALLGKLPEHFEIVRGVSHVQILPHMSLFICPGGIVTQAEAMYHGVPLIAVSNGFGELEWVGENIPRLGIGIHLKKADTVPAKIRKAAIQVLGDQTIRGNVRRLQNIVRRDAGGEETANRIEEYLESRTLE